MPTTTLDTRTTHGSAATPAAARPDPSAAAPRMNNRSVYAAWGLAWLVGYGSSWSDSST
jgi:hypothetical protein